MTVKGKDSKNKDIMVKIENVKEFWNRNPLCASRIPYPLGTKDYFDYYDKLREEIESLDFSYWLHEYKSFKGKRILDVGSGNGYVLSKYALEGGEVYGIDITETGIELCKKRFELCDQKGDFRVANAEELPFEDKMFDCVCSMGVLHHVPNTEKAVNEIFRVLKPGGRLIVMFYHRNSAKYRVRFFLKSIFTGISMRQLVNEVDGKGNPKGEVYSKKDLMVLLSQFKDIELFAGDLRWGHILPRGSRLLPNSLLRIFEKRWGWDLYAKGTRP